jgi:mRNA-degrading endonuclease RelE of RelBE toxin-antitoxin system
VNRAVRAKSWRRGRAVAAVSCGVSNRSDAAALEPKTVKPPWDHELPVWELRVGEYRVFYDVNDTERQVTVRAIRRKPPHATTEEIL